MIITRVYTLCGCSDWTVLNDTWEECKRLLYENHCRHGNLEFLNVEVLTSVYEKHERLKERVEKSSSLPEKSSSKKL